VKLRWKCFGPLKKPIAPRPDHSARAKPGATMTPKDKFSDVFEQDVQSRSVLGGGRRAVSALLWLTLR
jgi:hypothetical protein